MVLTPAHKRMVAVAGAIGLVAITIILLWERYETLSAKEKRAIDFVPVHPCSEKYQQPDFNPEVVLCYNSVAVSQTIVIPSSAFQTAVHRSQPKDYFGHTFYLDCTPYGKSPRVESGSWGTVFRSTDLKWAPNSYGWAECAQEFKRIIPTLMVTKDSVTLKVKSGHVLLDRENCRRVYLCAWISGRDPCWILRLCSLLSAGQDTTFNNTEGKLVVAGSQPRTKTIIIKEEDATDLVENVKSVMPHHWIHTAKRRSTRSWQGDDPTYIDSIGVPRGVPDEYKLVNQVSAGFESVLCWWCTINKNVDRINYIHFNVQKLGNKTEEGFSAIHEQLSATSLMAFQNRIAVDMLLAEKGEVCSIFGDQCCTFIPNNTAADGSLTRALEGLKSLNSKMKDHSGVDTSLWNGFGDMFGKYKQLVMSIIMSIAVFAAILTLCGCCCIPCIRALCTRMITTAIAPVRAEMREVYALLPFVVETPQENEDDDDEDMAVFLPD
ncbi:uncharacterized protein LOC114449162 [Parambassis ranga]|uniref:Uncharacterized protein LOC114449162 n=1 Tax=Parambassis ranga TaxID=210632 RepID=A0A6P7K0F6_9TELE|nr:uncharacterized protein LOC114449162 [Parambassis ranga]